MLLTVVYFPSNWELVWYNITFVLSIPMFQKMHNRIYSWDSVETFTGQVPQLPDQKPAEVVHFQPSNYKEQVWYAIVAFSCCCLFPVECAIAHITSVLNSKYHSNSPEIKLECYNKIQWHQSIVFPVCVYDLAEVVLHWEVDYSPFAKGAQRSCLV
jgi:hypothetical protein